LCTGKCKLISCCKLTFNHFTLKNFGISKYGALKGKVLVQMNKTFYFVVCKTSKLTHSKQHNFVWATGGYKMTIGLKIKQQPKNNLHDA